MTFGLWFLRNLLVSFVILGPVFRPFFSFFFARFELSPACSPSRAIVFDQSGASVGADQREFSQHFPGGGRSAVALESNEVIGFYPHRNRLAQMEIQMAAKQCLEFRNFRTAETVER